MPRRAGTRFSKQPLTQPFSYKRLAQLICDGHTTASASHILNRPEKFVEESQRTREYRLHFERACRRRDAARTTAAPETPVVEEIEFLSKMEAPDVT